MSGSDRACYGGDVDDVGGNAGFECREERPQAPDRPEVVRADELLDLLRRELEETAATGHAGVVDEQADRWMPLAYGRCDAVDLSAVGHVAKLVLGSDLVGDFPQPLLAAREQHEPPAAAGERPRDGGPDPARAAGDDAERARPF